MRPTCRDPRCDSRKFSPDGRLVSYLRGRNDEPNVYDLWAYDVASGRHRLLVDARLLAPEQEKLSAEEAARRDASASLRCAVSSSTTGRRTRGACCFRSPATCTTTISRGRLPMRCAG
jgi:hypothetical protein